MSASEHRSLRRWLLASMIAMVFGGIAGAGYFVVGGITGPASDAAAVFIGGFQVPVTILLHRTLGGSHPVLSVRARAIGVTGHLLFAASGAALVFLTVGYDLIPSIGLFRRSAFGVQLAGIMLEGAWLLMVSALTRGGSVGLRGSLPALVAGCGNFAFVAGTLLRSGPLAGLGGGAGLVGFLVWASIVRRDLRSPSLRTEA